jgi:small subunit ribosomal protein S7
MEEKKNAYSNFVGSLTKDGKKSVAQKIFDTTLLSVSNILDIYPEAINEQIEEKLDVSMEVKTITRGKRTHLIPVITNYRRQNFLVRKWIIGSAKENYKKVSFTEKLTSEIIDILTKKKSKSLEKRNSLLKLVRANRSNLHFRW